VSLVTAKALYPQLKSLITLYAIARLHNNSWTSYHGTCSCMRNHLCGRH